MLGVLGVLGEPIFAKIVRKNRVNKETMNFSRTQTISLTGGVSYTYEEEFYDGKAMSIIIDEGEKIFSTIDLFPKI